jgi:hypothetical protein
MLTSLSGVAMDDHGKDVDAESQEKKARHRSPNYPGIGLKEAVSRIEKVYRADGLAPALRDAALKHMGFERLSGDAGRVLSALRGFGLIQEEDGRLKLTQRGIDIVARPADDPKRAAALRDAAMSPAIYKDLLREYPGGRVSDLSLRSELLAVKKFNPNSVDDFIGDFRATIAFSGLTDIQVIELREENSGDDEVPLPSGDNVQSEPQPIPTRESIVIDATQSTDRPIESSYAAGQRKPGDTIKQAFMSQTKTRSYSWALSGDFSAKLDLIGEAQTEEDLDALADYMEITVKALKRSLRAAQAQAIQPQ